MRKPLRTITVPATALFAIALLAMTSPKASAEDYCRTDWGSGGICLCGFASLEQCQVMTSGRVGSCAPNPFPTPAGTSSAYEFQACQSMKLECGAYASMSKPHPKRTRHQAK